jgi:hypothetical protein
MSVGCYCLQVAKPTGQSPRPTRRASSTAKRSEMQGSNIFVGFTSKLIKEDHFACNRQGCSRSCRILSVRTTVYTTASGLTSSRLSDYSLVKELTGCSARLARLGQGHCFFCKRRWQLSLPSSWFPISGRRIVSSDSRLSTGCRENSDARSNAFTGPAPASHRHDAHEAHHHALWSEIFNWCCDRATGGRSRRLSLLPRFKHRSRNQPGV